ncbi:LOW QUALITY PROTEIN: integral membrane protein, partial [Streptomyces lividans TK24]
MIEWVPLGSGARPVPRPVAAPLVWAGAFGGALLLVGLLNGIVGAGRPGLALVALSLLAALLGLCARFTAAPGTAVLCWLSLNGFAHTAGRHAHLDRPAGRVLAGLPARRGPRGHGAGPVGPRAGRLPSADHGNRPGRAGARDRTRRRL